MKETQAALAAGADVLYEATFEHDGVLAVVDILRCTGPDTWHLIEVKSTTNYEAKKYLPDAALQAYVVRQSGVNVERVSIQYLNKEFQAPDVGDLFIQEEVTDAIDFEEVGANVEALKRVLVMPSAPPILIGSHCRSPYDCPFNDFCWAPLGKLTVFHVPKTIHHTRIKKLRDLGVVLLDEIPADFPFSEAEREGVDLILSQGLRVDASGVHALLSQVEFPIHFFDFETIDYSLPVFPGTHPYQKIPFQFSCHVLHDDGRLERTEYLHEDLCDPRPPLVEAMLGAIGDRGSVVAYHAPFERQIIRELIRDFPSRASVLDGIVERFWDLRDVFTGPYQDARFEGSTSIKKVLPVLCPDLTYDGLEVPDGTTAMAVWEEVVHGRSSDPARQLGALRRYCEQDSFAMVRLYQELLKV